jgi:hypothetical protein
LPAVLRGEIATATAGAAQQLTPPSSRRRRKLLPASYRQSAVTQTAQASLQGSIIYTANNKNQQPVMYL